MKKILHIVVIALLPLLLACSKTEEVGRSQLVVEGWIENGGNPVVMVSESIGIATGREMDSKGILDHIAKWAKVSISDGTRTEILTGIPDTEYFPPYIYTTSAITGEPEVLHPPAQLPSAAQPPCKSNTYAKVAS